MEDAWKTTEFTVLPHRDTKDVFILGGTDEIQVQLDDSRVAIATIASSRYVGPIQERVEDWQKQLNLMNETLEEWLNCQRNWLYLESIFSGMLANIINVDPQKGNTPNSGENPDYSHVLTIRKLHYSRNCIVVLGC